MSGPDPDIRPAVLDLGRALRNLDGAIIGGAAIALGSRARVTRDVDAVVKGESRSAEELLEALRGYGFSLRPGATFDLVRKINVLLLVHDASGVPADVAFGWLPFETAAIDRAVSIRIEGDEIPVARPEDLAVMKAIAGRPQDLLDLTTLLQVHLSLDRKFVRDQIEDFCELLEDNERLRVWDRLAKDHPSSIS